MLPTPVHQIIRYGESTPFYCFSSHYTVITTLLCSPCILINLGDITSGIIGGFNLNYLNHLNPQGILLYWGGLGHRCSQPCPVPSSHQPRWRELQAPGLSPHSPDVPPSSEPPPCPTLESSAAHRAGTRTTPLGD